MFKIVTIQLDQANNKRVWKPFTKKNCIFQTNTLKILTWNYFDYLFQKAFKETRKRYTTKALYLRRQAHKTIFTIMFSFTMGCTMVCVICVFRLIRPKPIKHVHRTVIANLLKAIIPAEGRSFLLLNIFWKYIISRYAPQIIRKRQLLTRLLRQFYGFLCRWRLLHDLHL